MGEGKAGGVNTRAYDEPSSAQQDCGGTACSMGEVEGTAEEGGLDTTAEQKEREREFSPALFFCYLPVHSAQLPSASRGNSPLNSSAPQLEQ
jgi:hypothetical protein